MGSVLTEQVLRRALERVRPPASTEREVRWANGTVCFIAPIETIIGMVAAGFVVFENSRFYVSIRAEHELRLRGITADSERAITTT